MNPFKLMELLGFMPNCFFEADPPDPSGGGGGGDPPVVPPADPPVPPAQGTFTQEQLNAYLKKEKDKHKTVLQQHLDRIKELEKGKNLSDEQRASLAISKSELEEQLLTAQQRAEKEKDKLTREHETVLSVETRRADTNWDLYMKTKKDNAISNAAVKHKAYRPEQLAAIVGPKCDLVAVKNENDEIVTWNVVVKAEVTKDDGSKEMKTMSVDQFVEHIKAQDDYTNLFLSERVGGSGYRPSSGVTHGADPSTMTPQEKIAAGMRQQANRGR